MSDKSKEQARYERYDAAMRKREAVAAFMVEAVRKALPHLADDDVAVLGDAWNLTLVIREDYPITDEEN